MIKILRYPLLICRLTDAAVAKPDILKVHHKILVYLFTRTEKMKDIQHTVLAVFLASSHHTKSWQLNCYPSCYPKWLKTCLLLVHCVQVYTCMSCISTFTHMPMQILTHVSVSVAEEFFFTMLLQIK